MCDCNFSLANKRFLGDSHFSVSHTLLPPAKVPSTWKKRDFAFGDLRDYVHHLWAKMSTTNFDGSKSNYNDMHRTELFL